MFAYSILLLHNCIPHNHHQAEEKHAMHSDKDHEDDDNDHAADDFLNHAFAHFQHDAGSDNTTLAKENLDAKCQINIVKTFVPLISAFILNLPVERKPVYLPPRHSFSLYSSLSFSTDPLRGPPALTA